MSLILTIETLSKTHRRSAFDCGEELLNHFLQKIARQHNDKGLSKTFVLVDQQQSEEIIAFITLVVYEVLTDQIPHQWAKKYPDRILAAKLARLAVAKDQQRKGYGQLLLIDALEKALDASQVMRIAGFFVDAKHEQAQAYYHQFGFLALPEQLDNLFMPISTIRKVLSRE